MHSDSPQIHTPVPTQWERQLGPLEQWFYVMNRHRRNHFSMAFQVDGEISAEECAIALAELQARHPLLKAFIEDRNRAAPYFRSNPEAIVSLRLSKGKGPTAWRSELEAESVTEIDTTKAPLLRAILLTSDGHSDLIFTIHHSVTDGMGLVLLMQDFFDVLSGQELGGLPVPQSVETVRDRLGLPSPVAVPDESGPASVALSTSFRPPTDRVTVSVMSLNAEQTDRVLRAARLHGATVHAALSAALVIAGRQLSDRWNDAPVRVFSPINLRESLGLRQEIALVLGAGVVRFERGDSLSLWEIARYGLKHLAPYRTLESNFFLGQVLGSVAVASESAPAVTAEHFGYELMLSNLGQIDLDLGKGQLRVTDIWGPAVNFGFAKEQIVGALTINGSLHLTHTSAAPIHGLVSKALELLLASST